VFVHHSDAQCPVSGSQGIDELFVLASDALGVGGGHVQEPERLGQRPVALGLGRIDLERRKPEEGEMELPVCLVRCARVGCRRRGGQLGVDLAQLRDLVIRRPARRPDRLLVDEVSPHGVEQAF
jgi:hypothetical protein